MKNTNFFEVKKGRKEENLTSNRKIPHILFPREKFECAVCDRVISLGRFRRGSIYCSFKCGLKEWWVIYCLLTLPVAVFLSWYFYSVFEVLGRGLGALSEVFNALGCMCGIFVYNIAWVILHRYIHAEVTETSCQTLCPWCGGILAERRSLIGDKCPECSQNVQCSVCRLPMVKSEEILQCDNGHAAHKQHLLEWLKIRASCPLCKTKTLSSSY